MIRLVIADDQALVRDGFCSILGREPDMEVVAEAADGAQAVAAVTRTRPDVALLDVRMPVMDGLQAGASRPRLRNRPDQARQQDPVTPLSARVSGGRTGGTCRCARRVGG